MLGTLRLGHQLVGQTAQGEPEIEPQNSVLRRVAIYQGCDLPVSRQHERHRVQGHVREINCRIRPPHAAPIQHRNVHWRFTVNDRHIRRVHIAVAEAFR